MRFYDDPQQVTRDFLQGEIHWANVWANSPELRSYLVYNPLFATTYFYFRSDREPFDDKRVRQGLALLLPWDQIRSSERSYFPSAGLVPAFADYPQVEGIRERDERRGLKLLDQAGYAGGRGLPTIEIKVVANSSAAQVARTMQEAWEGMLGVEVAVHEFSYRDLLEEIRAGDFTLAHQTWGRRLRRSAHLSADVDAGQQPQTTPATSTGNTTARWCAGCAPPARSACRRWPAPRRCCCRKR